MILLFPQTAFAITVAPFFSNKMGSRFAIQNKYKDAHVHIHKHNHLNILHTHVSRLCMHSLAPPMSFAKWCRCCFFFFFPSEKMKVVVVHNPIWTPLSVCTEVSVIAFGSSGRAILKIHSYCSDCMCVGWGLPTKGSVHGVCTELSLCSFVQLRNTHPWDKVNRV